MLNEEEIKEINDELKIYPNKQAACIEALKIVQNHRGWISDESVGDIAEYLELKPEEVDATATFYNLIYRKPVGRHVILLCDSVSCWVMGYEEILKHLKNRLGINYGETTPDNKFTLLPVVCLGTCDRAPALMIDKDLHQDLTPEKIDMILEKYI